MAFWSFPAFLAFPRADRMPNRVQHITCMLTCSLRLSHLGSNFARCQRSQCQRCRIAQLRQIEEPELVDSCSILSALLYCCSLESISCIQRAETVFYGAMRQVASPDAALQPRQTLSFASHLTPSQPRRRAGDRRLPLAARQRWQRLPSQPRSRRCRILVRAEQQHAAQGSVHPTRQQVRCVCAGNANLGVGFDWLGCAVEVGCSPRHTGQRAVLLAHASSRKSSQLASARLICTSPNSMWYFLHFWLLASETARPESQIVIAQGDGDIVTATALPGQPGVVRIDSITGDGGRLSLDAEKNCVGIAAAETLALLAAALGSPLACGVALQLQKVWLDANFSISFTAHSRIHPHLPKGHVQQPPISCCKTLVQSPATGPAAGQRPWQLGGQRGGGRRGSQRAVRRRAAQGDAGAGGPQIRGGCQRLPRRQHRAGAARRFHPRQVKRLNFGLLSTFCAA